MQRPPIRSGRGFVISVAGWNPAPASPEKPRGLGGSDFAESIGHHTRPSFGRYDPARQPVASGRPHGHGLRHHHQRRGVRYARGDKRVGADAVSIGRYRDIPRHYPLGGLPLDSVSTKSGGVPSWASRPARWGDSLQGIAYENGLAGVCEHTIMKGRNRYADLQA